MVDIFAAVSNLEVSLIAAFSRCRDNPVLELDFDPARRIQRFHRPDTLDLRRKTRWIKRTFYHLGFSSDAKKALYLTERKINKYLHKVCLVATDFSLVNLNKKIISLFYLAPFFGITAPKNVWPKQV